MKWYTLLLASMLVLGCSDDDNTTPTSGLLGGGQTEPTKPAPQGTQTEPSVDCKETNMCPEGFECIPNAAAQYRCVPTGSPQPNPAPMAGKPTMMGGTPVTPMAGNTAMGGSQGGIIAAGGSPAGGRVAGGAEAGGEVAGGTQAGGAIAGGAQAGGVAGGAQTGGSTPGGAQAGGEVVGGAAAGGAINGAGMVAPAAGMPNMAGGGIPPNGMGMAGGGVAGGQARPAGQCVQDLDCMGGNGCNRSVPGGACFCPNCPVGSECLNGTCVADCQADSDCPQGTDCAVGVGRCEIRSCQNDGDCGSPQLRCGATNLCTNL